MKKRTMKLIFALLLLASTLIFMAMSYSSENQMSSEPQASQNLQSISPVQAQSLIQQRPDLLILDVRTPPELKEGFIEGSELFDFWTVVKGNHTLPRNRPILLVCAVGGRSYFAGTMLKKAGYAEIYNLSGGISAWKEKGLPLQY